VCLVPLPMFGAVRGHDACLGSVCDVSFANESGPLVVFRTSAWRHVRAYASSRKRDIRALSRRSIPTVLGSG
jgi:hypothetical protein